MIFCVGGSMRVIVISESLIIRKGIISILKEEDYISSIKDSYIFKDVYNDEYDLVIVDLNRNNNHYLSDIQNIKQDTKTKIMILDFYEDRSLFSQCMKIGVDGYILANIDSEDIDYAVKQIYRGKKYFDADLIENYLSKRDRKSVV